MTVWGLKIEASYTKGIWRRAYGFNRLQMSIEQVVMAELKHEVEDSKEEMGAMLEDELGGGVLSKGCLPLVVRKFLMRLGSLGRVMLDGE